MNNRESGQTNERDLEKDRQAFIDAISAVPIREIPTDFDEVAAESLAANLEKTKLFIMGEIHGVKENADIIYTLFKRFGFRQLALEWEPRLKPVADRFLESGEIDFDEIKDSPDGRVTPGHFALIKKLKDEGMLENLICCAVGSGGAGWNKSDENMAKVILENLSDSPTLVVAGYHHAKTEEIIFSDSPDPQHPMGENVKKVIPDVPSGKIDYMTGQYHNFGTEEFGDLSPGERFVGERFYQNEQGAYVYELDQAHAAIVPNPDERLD